MLRGRGNIAPRSLRYPDRIISSDCNICNAINAFKIRLEFKDDYDDAKLQRDAEDDAKDFSPRDHDHTADYHRLLPELPLVAVLHEPFNLYTVGHPFSLYACLTAEYALRLGRARLVPPGCLVQLRPDAGSYSPTREGDIVCRALHHFPRPADNAVDAYSVMADASYALHGYVPGRIPRCSVLVNIGLAAPTISCVACVSYSGGSAKYTQVAVSAFEAHRDTLDHGRCHLRLARALSPPDSPPLETYVLMPEVITYFRELSGDSKLFAEALHKALYVYNMMERHFAFGDNSSWHMAHNVIASMAADRALLIGKRCVGKTLQWEGAETWNNARLQAAELSESIASQHAMAEGKGEHLDETLAEDTALVERFSALRRVRLSTLLRAQAARDTADYARVLAAQAVLFEHEFDPGAAIMVPALNEVYPLPVQAPATSSEALSGVNGPAWSRAMEEEMESMDDFGVWELPIAPL